MENAHILSHAPFFGRIAESITKFSGSTAAFIAATGIVPV